LYLTVFILNNMQEISYWLLCGTDFCLFIYAISCLFIPPVKSFRTKLLGVIFLILAWYIFMALLILTGRLVQYPFLFRAGVPFYYAVIPLLYLYLRTSYDQSNSFKKFDWLHFIPVILCFIDLFPYLFLMPLPDKRMEMESYLKDPMAVVVIGRGIFPAVIHYYLRALQGIVYLFLAGKLFFIRVNTINQLKYKQAKIVTLLLNIVFAGNTMMCLSILKKGTWFSFYQMNSMIDMIILLMIISLVILCIYIYNKPSLFNENTLLFAAQQSTIENHTEFVIEESKESTDYLKKTISDLSLLENLMSVSQAYRRKGYTLQLMAKELQIAPHVLSATLNAYYNQHFNDYVNAYRINYIIERIRSDKDWKKLSIEGLADEAGFASRTPFYTAFKKHTGLTPSAYIQQYKQEHKYCPDL